MWEHSRSQGVTREFDGDRAFERLVELVPNPTIQLLFFPGSDEDVAAAYRGTIDVIVAVIAECSFHEYVIAPLGIEWFVCENHHGVVIAAGEPVESRLRTLSPVAPGPEGLLVQELDAHDALVERGARGELTWAEFETAYDNFYVRYPLDGHESDEVELLLFQKHAGRIALHRDIWEQVLAKLSRDTNYQDDGAGFIGPDEAVRRLAELVRRHRSDAGAEH